MKTWNKKVNIPKIGICIVKEFTEQEVADFDTKHPGYHSVPESVGFVNLFHDEEYVGWCGKDYARQHQIIAKGEILEYDIHATQGQNFYSLKVRATSRRQAKKIAEKTPIDKWENSHPELFEICDVHISSENKL